MSGVEESNNLGAEATYSTSGPPRTPVFMAVSDCSPVISSPTDVMSVSSTESFGSTDSGQAQNSANSNGSGSHTATDPSPQYRKHERFYFDDGNVTFVVEDVAFRVHRYFFQRDSKYFADLFKQQSSEGAGREDEPIQLNDVASDEFEAFLKLMYPLNLFTQELSSLSAWTAALRLSVRWSFASLRALAIGKLTTIAPPVDKIVLGRTYDVPAWLCPGFVALCQRKAPLTRAEANRLGVADVVMIAGLRESIRAQKAPWSERSVVNAVEMCLKSPEVLDRGHVLPLEPVVALAQADGMDVDAKANVGDAAQSGGQKTAGSDAAAKAAETTQAASYDTPSDNLPASLRSGPFTGGEKKITYGWGIAAPAAAPSSATHASMPTLTFAKPSTRPATKNTGPAAERSAGRTGV